MGCPTGPVRAEEVQDSAVRDFGGRPESEVSGLSFSSSLGLFTCVLMLRCEERLRDPGFCHQYDLQLRIPELRGDSA